MASSAARKVVIVGSGPAAHTAAIYASRAMLEPLVFEGFLANGIAAGGQLTTTTDVENFPGHVSISGPDLTTLFRDQSVSCGAEILTETVDSVDLASRPFTVNYGSGAGSVKAETLVIATGAVARRLDIPNADLLWNRGVSACAVCDGAAPIFRNKPVVVIGGGDTAMEEAMFLTRFASEVIVVHRRGELRAGKVMQERARRNGKVRFVMGAEVVECVPHGEGLQARLGAVVVAPSAMGSPGARSNDGGDDSLAPLEMISGTSTIEAAGLFFAVGHTPATAFLDGQLALDEDGYVEVAPGTAHTSVPGVFAAGDVADKKYRQAVTAAGTGCMAALDAEHFLVENGM